MRSNARARALQQQVAILAPAVKKQKIAAFEKKQKAFQAKVQTRQEEIQGGVMQARQDVEKALGPILQGIMAERGANLLMDRSAIVLGTVERRRHRPRRGPAQQEAVDGEGESREAAEGSAAARPQG